MDYYSTGVEKFNAGEYLLAMEYFQAELEKHPHNTEAQSYLEKVEKEIQQQRLNSNTRFKRNQGQKPFQKTKSSSHIIRNNQNTQNPLLAKIFHRGRMPKFSLADVIMWVTGGILLLFMLYLIVHFREGLKYPYGLYFFGYVVCLFIVSAIVVSVFDDSGFDGGAIMAMLVSPLAVWFIMKCVGAHPVALVIVFCVMTGLCCFFANRSNEVEIRISLYTFGAFCVVWALFFLIPIVWKPIAERQIARTEEQLESSKMQIHQKSDSLRVQRQNQAQETGFMGLMIGDNYGEVLKKCRESESILSVTPYTPSYYEEKVKGIEFDSVLKIKALWDNNEVDAKIYCLNSKTGVIKFNINASNTIVSTYEKKYGKPEVNVEWSRIEPRSRSYPRWSEENRRFPYYDSLYMCWVYYKRWFALDTVGYLWTFSNASISLKEQSNWHDYWTVEYVASWVLDTVRVRHERDSLMRVQKQQVEEQRKYEEDQARRQAAMEERKRRDESHWRAVDNI